MLPLDADAASTAFRHSATAVLAECS